MINIMAHYNRNRRKATVTQQLLLSFPSHIAPLPLLLLFFFYACLFVLLFAHLLNEPFVSTCILLSYGQSHNSGAVFYAGCSFDS